MAKIGIFETPPQRYFNYDEDTEVLLEFISKERMGTIIAKADEVAKKMKMPQSKVYDMFLGKAAVLGWRHKDQENMAHHPGLVLPSGAPLVFSSDNRNLLMKACTEFSGFVFGRCTNSSLFLDREETAGEEDLDLATMLEAADLEENGGQKNA
jgi:hypothetical protein